MIGSFNFYYAKPGMEDAVLRQRLAASDVRVAMGIPRGRVLRKTSGAPTLPDVVWEYHFTEMAGHHADMAARAASPEFEAIRAGMRKLYRRFERPLFELCADAPYAATVRVVALDWIFCAPDETAQILAAVKACLRQQPAPGRIFRLITPGDDLPELIWQHEFADIRACDDAAAKIAASPDLSSWTSAIKPPARLERSVWTVE
jgi:hypothetical protein